MESARHLVKMMTFIRKFSFVLVKKKIKLKVFFLKNVAFRILLRQLKIESTHPVEQLFFCLNFTRCIYFLSFTIPYESDCLSKLR